MDRFDDTAIDRVIGAEYNDIFYNFVSCSTNEDNEEHEYLDPMKHYSTQEWPVTYSSPSTEEAWLMNHTQFASTSVSNTFRLPSDEPPNIILISANDVSFLVHQSQLLRASTSCWNGLLAPEGQNYPYSIRLDEDANTLDVVLHAIYRLPMDHLSPNIIILLTAIRSLKDYGVPLKPIIFPEEPLFNELVAKASYLPLEVYIVAAENDLFELAREVSTHLVTLQINTLTDENALRLGSSYLRMLYYLHVERTRVLKRLVVQTPKQHSRSVACGEREYRVLQLEWAKVSSKFILSQDPGVSAEVLRASFSALNFTLACPACIQSAESCSRDIVTKWSKTPNTICRDPKDFWKALSTDGVPTPDTPV